MSMVIKAIFDCEDFAQYAASRIKNSVPGYIRSSIKRYHNPDTEQERRSSFWSVFSPYSVTSFSSPVVYPTMSGINVSPGSTNQNGLDTLLELECEDAAVRRAESIIRSMSGREILSQPTKK